MRLLSVSRRTLLLIACAVWFVAGFNIVRLGVLAYANVRVNLVYALLSVAVGVTFWKMVFSRLVLKHTTRIRGYEEDRHFFLKFFDVPSFVIMACMMTGGIAIRSLHLAPEPFIAVFYTGLGCALALAGLLFGRNWLRFGEAELA